MILLLSPFCALPPDWFSSPISSLLWRKKWLYWSNGRHRYDFYYLYILFCIAKFRDLYKKLHVITSIFIDKAKLGTGYYFWDWFRKFSHKFTWIVLSVHKLNKLVNLLTIAEYHVKLWLIWKNVYNNLIIINL